MTASDSTYPIPSIPDHAFPPFVHTPEDPERGELSVALAERTSAQYEPDGRPNSQFVFHYARTVFFSEIPTGLPDDPPAAS